MGPLSINLPAAEGDVRLFSKRHRHLRDLYENASTLTPVPPSGKLFQRYNSSPPNAHLRVPLQRLQTPRQPLLPDLFRGQRGSSDVHQLRLTEPQQTGVARVSAQE